MNPINILVPVNHPPRSVGFPYDLNGGTVVGIAGDDFAVIGADTRLTANNMVQTRDLDRLFQLTDKTIVGSSGCFADTLGFVDILKRQVEIYQFAHGRPISVEAAAQLMSVLMYNRRFFPYFITNVLVGLDSKGKGQVYVYDPIGHHELLEYGACGSGGRMVAPVLDNLVAYKNRAIDPKDIPKPTKEIAIGLICDAFASVGERDIKCGDSVILKIITKDGIEEIRKALRTD